MEYVTLGRTGLQVSVAGLGCGGFSRLGLGNGKSEAEAVALIRQAIDLGVNLFDTAAAYGTGRGARQGAQGGPARGGRDRNQGAVQRQQSQLEYRKCRRRLARQLAAPARHRLCQRVRARRRGTPRLRPRAQRCRACLACGKGQGQVSIRHLAITKNSTARSRAQDAAARRRRRRVGRRDGRLSHDAPERPRSGLSTDPRASGRDIADVRGAQHLLPAGPARGDDAQLAAEGEVPQWLAETPDPLAFLIREGGARSVIDAAYRFVRHEPGVDVVLFGTGDPEHLRTNIASLLAPPLPEADRARLASLFGHLVGVGLDAPHLTRRARA